MLVAGETEVDHHHGIEVRTPDYWPGAGTGVGLGGVAGAGVAVEFDGVVGAGTDVGLDGVVGAVAGVESG